MLGQNSLYKLSQASHEWGSWLVELHHHGSCARAQACARPDLPPAVTGAWRVSTHPPPATQSYTTGSSALDRNGAALAWSIDPIKVCVSGHPHARTICNSTGLGRPYDHEITDFILVVLSSSISVVGTLRHRPPTLPVATSVRHMTHNWARVPLCKRAQWCRLVPPQTPAGHR